MRVNCSSFISMFVSSCFVLVLESGLLVVIVWVRLWSACGIIRVKCLLSSGKSSMMGIRWLLFVGLS